MRLQILIAAGIALLVGSQSASAQQLDARVSLNTASLVNHGFGAFELGRRFGDSGAAAFIEVGKWWIDQYPVCLLGPCDFRVITESANSGVSFGLPREKKGWRVEASASAVLYHYRITSEGGPDDIRQLWSLNPQLGLSVSTPAIRGTRVDVRLYAVNAEMDLARRTRYVLSVGAQRRVR